MSAISELSHLKQKGPVTPEQRAARRKEQSHDNKAAYLFLLPWLVGLFLFTLGPILASLYLSMTDYSLIQAPNFLGLDNYERMLTDGRLHQSLKVTLIYVGVGVPMQLALALAVAVLLNKGMRGWRSTGRCSICPRCWVGRSRSRCCGVRSSARPVW